MLLRSLSNKAMESETSKDRFPHFQTLKSDNRVPQNEGYPSRLKTARHKNIENTMIYTDVERALFQILNDGSHVKVARTPEEINRCWKLASSMSARRMDYSSSESVNEIRER